jgi:uncharacterized protein (TIGR02246 family)
MRKLLWSVLALMSAFVSGASTAFAAAPVATAESLVERFVAAWNSHDLAAFDKLFAPGVTWVATFDARNEGRETVLKDFQVAHEGWAKNSSVAASDALVTNPRPDVAIVQFNLMMTMGQGKEPLGRTLLLVASREADGWKIAAGQLTKPNCPEQR